MKRHAPATLRNRDPLLDVLKRWLPGHPTVLEISAGSGEHAAYFAPRFPGHLWRPTDMGAAELASIEGHRADADAPNLLPAMRLDVRERPWSSGPVHVVFCANMIHIAPWECCVALFEGAAEVLAPGGLLLLYGPFRIDGRHTADSNASFDEWLRSQDPRWGVRDLGEVNAVARAAGFEEVERNAMPANNLTVVWRLDRPGASPG